MSQTQQQQGTTLAILAPYLPYGIEVEISYTDAVIRGRLTGLTLGSEYIETERPTVLNSVPHKAMTTIALCLPILRPFSALTEPLEDGTVPIEELVRQACPDRYTRLFIENGMAVKRRAGLAEDAVPGRRRDAIEVWGASTAEAIFTIYSDWTIIAPMGVQSAIAADYLRSQHFAVGLGPGQYIEKVLSAAL